MALTQVIQGTAFWQPFRPDYYASSVSDITDNLETLVGKLIQLPDRSIYYVNAQKVSYEVFDSFLRPTFFDSALPRINSVVTVSVPTTLDETHEIVIVNNGSTITLPTALGIQGRYYNIIRSGTLDVLISPVLSQTISGDDSLTLTSQWDSVAFVSDNSNWVRCS